MQTCTKGNNNSGIFKNVSIDIGVIGMQGKATETRKTVILTITPPPKKNKTKKQTNKNNNNKTKQKKKKKKSNTHYQITFEKNCVNSTEMYTYIWHLLAS